MTWSGDEPPAGEGRNADRATPAGSGGEFAREQWRAALRLAALERNRRKGRRRGTDRRGTLPARAGMNRRMPPPGPPDGDAA